LPCIFAAIRFFAGSPSKMTHLLSHVADLV
jgi:hypothetical protein